jgi:5-methylcytosine-specific restriction endonuclease McrA
MKTLLLTPWMTPHNIVPWQTAVTLLFLGKVEILEEYDEEIRSPSVTLRAPAVARLKTAVGSVKRGVKFSRVNVFTRDGFKCQYCGTRRAMRELNYDHVVPRAHGGRTVWENIVTSCYPCNDRKAGRTPEQAGMRLLRHPIRPKSLPMSALPIDVSAVPTEWVGYCISTLPSATPASSGAASLQATGLARPRLRRGAGERGMIERPPLAVAGGGVAAERAPRRRARVSPGVA